MLKKTKSNLLNCCFKRLTNKLSLTLLTLLFLSISNVSFGAGTLTAQGSGVKPVTIKSHDVNITINNGFAITEVTQVFSNQNQQTVEAIYSFPLPKSASMSEVMVQIGEKTINGEVVDTATADKIYGTEKNKGNNVAKASKNSYIDFKFNVANIKANEDVTIKFVYYQPLEIDTGVGRYVYPLEEGNTDEVANSFWERNDTVAGKTTISMNLKSAVPLANIRVPNVANATKADMTKLSQGQFSAKYELTTSLTKDFVFYYLLEKNLPGRLEVIPYKIPNSKEGTFMMVVTPGLDLQPLKNGADYIFVLDVSGSMSGEKIRTMCDGVNKSIGKMNINDRFRIITFESNAHELTSAWVNATAENVQLWTKKISNINSAGGTDLYAGLSKAVRCLDADRVSSLILVTDAATNKGVLSSKAFYTLMKKYDVRVFGFLIGNSTNFPLMRTICNASGGFYESVSNSDDIIGSILKAKQKITHECLRDVSIKITGVKTFDLTNDKFKKIYNGQQIIVLGHYTGSGTATVQMHAKLTGNKKVYSTKFNFPATATENPELERLWALSRIEQFEDLTNSGAMIATESQSVIKDLGIKYQLVTDETSMIVMSDDKFTEYKIQRNNKKRLKNEHQAQAQRKTNGVKNYIVNNNYKQNKPRANANTNKKSSQSTPIKRHKNKRMFSYNTPTLGGGGAIDGFSGLIIIFTALVSGLGIASKRKVNNK